MNEETLFHKALERPPAERTAFLNRAAAGQPKLRAAVDALLAAHEATGNELDFPPIDMSRTAATDESGSQYPLPSPSDITTFVPNSEPSVLIASRYALLEKIGEGGMGEVWVAKQTEPVKRRVALKLIKKGMDSKAVLSRFEQERQALAMMDHPNIARVLDGGITPTGQPFFVMELVNGLALSKFCDEAKLTPRQRLELFIPICQAVQHAHQKGIVHRDLKPANILITVIDGKPIPKIIDFGVAKATAGKLTDESHYTQFGSVVGTLEYMAPEQAGFAGTDIDTRADIYSLGVILYELLTGLKPIDAKRLKNTALLEMIRVIKEEEPSKPSTRLSTDKSMRSLAALRQTEPARLMAMLRGELDWVIMKCLEKSRDRRYETANGLARDIQRYLSDLPVEARPPSAGYRFSKFLRRNKVTVIAASLILVALLAGIIGTTVGLVEARRQEHEALYQAQLAREETLEKEKARAAATLLAEGERLAKLEARAEAAAKEEARAAEASRAEGERRAKLAAQAAEKLAGERLAQVQAAQQKAEEANQVAQKVRDFFQHTVLGSRNLRQQGNDEQLQAGGVFAEPLENPTIREMLVRAAAQLAPDKIEASFPNQPILQSEFLWSIGDTYREVGEYDVAIGLLKRAVAIQTQHLGADSHVTTNSMNILALTYNAVGKLPEATALWEAGYASRLKIYGPNDSGTLVFQDNLAIAYVQSGRVTEGLTMLEQVQAARAKTLGADAPATLMSLSTLAAVYRSAGKFPEAIASLKKLYDARVKILGADHASTVATQASLATVYLDAGKRDDAAPLIKDLLARARKQMPNDLQLAAMLATTSHALLNAKAFTDAEPLLRECLAIREKMEPEAWTTFNARSMLGAALLGQKKIAEAEPLLLAGYEGMKKQESTIPAQGKVRIPLALDRLIELFTELKKPDEVQKYQDERAKYPQASEKK